MASGHGVAMPWLATWQSHSQSHSQGQAVPRMHQIKRQQSTSVTTARCLAPDVLATRCNMQPMQTPIERFSHLDMEQQKAPTPTLPLFYRFSNYALHGARERIEKKN